MKPPEEPRFVSIEAVLRLHAYAIEDRGGNPRIRDRRLLESALLMHLYRIAEDMGYEW